MSKLIAILSLFVATPAFATPEQTYRPFRYETPCLLEQGIQTYPDTCVVIETREKGGFLRTRNIYSNKHALTIKGRFDKEKGFADPSDPFNNITSITLYLSWLDRLITVCLKPNTLSTEQAEEICSKKRNLC